MFTTKVKVTAKDQKQISEELEKINQELKIDDVLLEDKKPQHRLFHRNNLTPKKQVRFADEVKLERRWSYP